MTINRLQNEIMVYVNKQPDAMVDYSCFPSEPAYRVNYAIEQLSEMGLITAKQSIAELHWTAYTITPKGKIYMEEEGLNS